jgi:sugar porter (SP) family MFS transporter
VSAGEVFLMAAPTEAQRTSQVFFYIAMVSTIAAVGGTLFGYDTGVISGAILYVTRDFQLSESSEGLAVSAVTAGALIGALLGGTLADRLGRRLTNILAGLLFVFSSIVCGLAPGIEVLVAGRFIIGVAVGMTSVAAPMYIAEVAPPAIRGRLVSFFQLAITLGILVAYLVDMALAESGSWRWMLGLAVIPGTLLAVGMLLMPESPRWLLKHRRNEEARRVLHLVRSQGVEEEVRDIEAEIAREGEGSWSDLLTPALRPALVVGIGLAVFQQVTGINAVIYYAPQIFLSAGFTSDAVALAATTGIGVINVLATFIAIGLVDRAGRRPLLLAGVAGMVLSLGVLGLAFQDRASAAPGDMSHLGLLTVVCLALYIICFAFSLGPIVWTMISEIFPLRTRAQAVAISTAANWAANFLVSLSFPILRAHLGSAETFYIYAGLGVLTLIFILMRVPETKGKSLEEIERMWRA